MQPLPAISMLSDGMQGRQGEARRPGGFLKGLIDVNVWGFEVIGILRNQKESQERATYLWFWAEHWTRFQPTSCIRRRIQSKGSQTGGGVLVGYPLDDLSDLGGSMIPVASYHIVVLLVLSQNEFKYSPNVLQMNMSECGLSAF